MGDDPSAKYENVMQQLKEHQEDCKQTTEQGSEPGKNQGQEQTSKTEQSEEEDDDDEYENEDDFEDYDDEFEDDDELPLDDSSTGSAAVEGQMNSVSAQPPAAPQPASVSSKNTPQKQEQQSCELSDDEIEEVEEDWSVEESLDESFGS